MGIIELTNELVILEDQPVMFTGFGVLNRDKYFII